METIKEFLENPNKPMNAEMEQLMVKHLPYCLSNANFIRLPISSLCRIFEMFTEENPDYDQLEIINFCFRYFEAHEIDASILFAFIKVSKHEEYFLEMLMKHEDIFDFAFLKPCHIKYLFDQNNVLKQLLSKRFE